jgi:Fe-S-cluster-containing dehydrogenase component
MAQRAMVIDLQKCVSCGACALSCKTENNTRNSNSEGTFNWADFVTITEGQFPDSKFISIPVLCNHCTNAPCVEICPVTPKAIFKSADGVTIRNEERCIGCRYCQDACPYSTKDVAASGALYSVISYNHFDDAPYPFYEDDTVIIQDGSSSPAAMAALIGSNPPDRNEYTHADYNDMRAPNIVEQCIFCDHRVLNGEQPYCVVSCPSGARVVGDIDDPDSEVSQLLSQYSYFRLKNNNGEILQPGEEGTGPNVYYIRRFENNPTATKEEKSSSQVMDFIKLYPNPTTDHTKLEVTVKSPDYMDCMVFSVAGQIMSKPVANEFMTAGTHTVDLKLDGLKSGTYIVHVTLGKHLNTKRLIIQK